MKQELQAQYQTIRVNIQSNVVTIGNLIKQAHNLREIVKGFNGAAENAEIKGQLEKEIEAIENTIETLITQTDLLFDSYNSFVENLSK